MLGSIVGHGLCHSQLNHTWLLTGTRPQWHPAAAACRKTELGHSRMNDARHWRGRTARKFLYLGSGLLLLGYAGSRFVLEVVLQRP